VCPPESRIGPLTDAERAERAGRSPLRDKYTKTLDRESAYEVLKAKASAAPPRVEPDRKKAPTRTRQSASEAMLKSTLRAIGSSLGRQLVRGILGSLTRRR
jgi:hypothetical protein